MKTYPLADGLTASRIGYGCMHLSRAWDASPITADERRSAQRLVETALAHGITLFDHADIYARGKSEQVFGDVLRATLLDAYKATTDLTHGFSTRNLRQ